MTEAWLEPLSHDACLQCLRQETVGRMAVVVNDDPIILPVNYRLVEPPSGPLLVVRTRPGNVLEQAISNVAFEIDSIDRAKQEGWSVLVQGELLHAYPASATARELYEPDPWVIDDRKAWLFIDPFAISGRQLHGTERDWPFHPGDYM
jgi:nitroimidazol reductase NimA-like FMN-containing flavoprotein (pyridoxamine 5'-phosphate oxidase superfamily)